MNRTALGLGAILLAVILAAAVLWPTVQQVRTVTIEKDARLEVLASKQKRYNDLKALANTFATQQSRINKLVTTLPADPQIAELLVTIEAMGQESGVTLSSITPQVNTREQKVTLGLIGEGDLTSVERLMQAVGDNNRPMSVSSVSLARTPDGKRVSFTLNVFAPYIAGSNRATTTREAS